ncbi:MAG TPA: hypothetical protein VKU19_23975 [Bryobacteraceae bacterium]|nr:hypothetical protein [Bryobacteraceae bacterium]
MALDLVVELVNLCVELTQFGQAYGKSRDEQFYRRLEKARSTPGKPGDLLLAKFCNDCERRSAKTLNDSHLFMKWGIALRCRASRAEVSEADRLCAEADQKFSHALAIDSNNEEIHAARVETILRRAQLHSGSPEGCRLLTEACEMCRRRVGIVASGKHDARLLWVWGASLAGLAEIEKGAEAERLYDEAEAKFRRAYGMWPEPEFQLDRAQALLYRSMLHRGDDRQEMLTRVCDLCRGMVENQSGGYKALVIWGAALSCQVAHAGPDAERIFAEGNEQFARAKSVDPERAKAEITRVLAKVFR